MIITDGPRRLQPATDNDLEFARELTRVNMRVYYLRYGLVWQPEAFDAEWSKRESYLVIQADQVVGFVGVTLETDYLYVRDVQLIEAHRRQGVGTWVMTCVAQMAIDRGCTNVRLKVFKSNPAVELYHRLGYLHVGQEAALWWMECAVNQQMSQA